MKPLNQSLRLTSLAVFPLLAALLTGCGAAVAGSSAAPGMPDTISVSGQGEVSAAPDQATFNLGVTRDAASASEAIDSVNEELSRVIQRLRAEGVPADCLQTQQLSVQPLDLGMYEPVPAPVASASPEAAVAGSRPLEPVVKPRVVFRASNSLVVKVTDMSRLGGLLGVGIDAGANTLGGLSFSFKDSKALDAEARRLAIVDAAERARQLAAAGGVELGELVLVVEEGGGPVPPGPYPMMATMKSAAMPVESGSLSVVQNVRVVYRIER